MCFWICYYYHVKAQLTLHNLWPNATCGVCTCMCFETSLFQVLACRVTPFSKQNFVLRNRFKNALHWMSAIYKPGCVKQNCWNSFSIWWLVILFVVAVVRWSVGGVGPYLRPCAGPCLWRLTWALLCLNDEFFHAYYGSVVALSRQEERFVPLPQVRGHNLTFYMIANGEIDCFHPNPQGFHLKIFGSLRHRYISLAVPKCESRLLRTLKTSLDQSASAARIYKIVKKCMINTWE